MSIIRDITLKAVKAIDSYEILLFIGARQAGKTTILKQIQSVIEKGDEKTYFLNLEDPDYLSLLNKSPKNLFDIFNLNLKKRNFIFVDEIQYLHNPSNFLKYFYDEYKETIKIIASGSSAFYLDKKFKDSLAGRKRIFNVRTLSFREFLRFKNEAALSKEDFRALKLALKDKLRLYYLEYIIFGGYPRLVLSSSEEEKKDILQDIAYSYIKKDIYEADIKQDEVFYKLFKILASQTGNLVNASELSSTLGVSKSAVDNYLYVMQKSFHIVLIKPFFKNLRKELTKMPKVYFLDLGLRNFFANNFGTFSSRGDKGQLLENALLRQLLDKYEEDKIRFWRTIQKNEIDFVVDEKQALEVKVNLSQFKKKNYRLFLEAYPDMRFFLVSLDIKDKSGYPYALEVWEV